MPNIQLAKNLRELRKFNKFTQEHLSTLLNVSRQAYSNYENCKRTPDLGALIRLSQIYKISMDKLINQNVGNTVTEEQGPYSQGISIVTGNTLYLTNNEIELLMNYRDLSVENKKIIDSFIKEQTKK